MINKFRSKGIDSLIIFMLVSFVSIPYVLLIISKSYTPVDEALQIMNLLFWNLILSFYISTMIYVKHMVALDNAIKINDHKVINIISKTVIILIFCYNCYTVISGCISHNPGLQSIAALFFILDRYQQTIVIGDKYLTYYSKTIRLDSIESIHKIQSALFSDINIKLKDGFDMKIYASENTYNLICEKLQTKTELGVNDQ